MADRTHSARGDLPSPAELGRLLRREVRSIDVERADAIGAERALAIHFEGGPTLSMPPGNRLRTAGDIVELRALLEGWPRTAASAAKAPLATRAPDDELIEAAIAALHGGARVDTP